MLLFVSQLQALYPTLAEFAREKGWRCGKSFISDRAKCYRNPKTGKIAYKTVTNKRTGRKNKVKVGLNYKEYQKARKAAIKKQGQGKRTTELEKKYIADADRLAQSTRKKKQRAKNAKTKRQAAKLERSQPNKSNNLTTAQRNHLSNSSVKSDDKKVSKILDSNLNAQSRTKTKSKNPQETINKTTQSKSQNKIGSYQDFVNTRKRILDGDITAEEIKQAQLDLRTNEKAILEDLGKLKKDNLLKMAGWGMRRSDKKDRLVNSAYQNMEQALLPPGFGALSYSYAFGKDGAEQTRKNRRAAIDKQMANWSDDLVKDLAKERKQAIAEREQQFKEPKTIDDFRTIVRFKGKEGLTPQQRRTYEELVTVKNREERKKTAPKAQAVELPANKSFKLAKTVHTKKGHDVYVASLTERVDRDKYNELNQRAKSLGGYYSRYGRDGAIPGFQFRDEETARKFMGLNEVESNDRSGEKQTKTVNSLRSNAERLIERNEEKLNQDRLVNTARRARMAAGVEDDARGEIAIGKTMLKLAEEKEAGNIQFLDRVKAGTEVRQLNQLLNSSRHKAARAIAEKTYPGDNQYSQRNRKRDEILDKPIDDDTIEYADYPYPNIHKDQLRSMIDEVESQKGMKLLSNRLEKKWKAIAKKDAYLVDFKTDKEIEDFRRFTSQGRFSRYQYGAERAKETLKDYDRINKTLDLKTPYELRAALREYNRLRSKKASEDPIKVKERELIGRKIEGYFPTPKPVIDKMLEYADLKTGQKVLEPSAGKGNIADRLREEVGNDTVSTIEIDPKLSELLDLKGYNNRRDDFLNITDESYDRIVMNPPFERLQDIDHLKQAYELLEPGGRVVSVMSESPFFQQQTKAKEFRKWLAEKDGWSEKLPENSFKNSERSTGVNTRLVVIEKPITEKKKSINNYSLNPKRLVYFDNTLELSSLLFAKKCGKGYIPDNKTCYTNKQGKTNFTYKINPKTGRRNKTRRKVKSDRLKSKPTLATKLKKAIKDPSGLFDRLKNNIQNVWEDLGSLLYTDNDRYKLRKPNRSSTSKPFRKPDIKTARENLVKKAIAKNPPAKVPQYLAKNLNENQKQEVGMAINAMNRDGGFLLSNGTGTGKTRTQLATADMMAKKGKKVLIVSKSEVLKPKWSGKNQGVTGSFKEDARTMGIKTKLTKTGLGLKNGEIGLSTYSNLDKLKYAVDQDTVLIFDEAHSFKNADSARSKHGMEMMQEAHSVLYATATPADKPGHLDYLFRANVFNGNSKKDIYNWLGLESYSVKKGDGYVQRFKTRKGVKPEDVSDRLNGLFDQMTENGNTIKREISLKGVDVGFAEINVSRESRKKMRDIAQAYKNSPSPLAKAQMLMQQRRQLEVDKVPAAVELVEDAMARGRKPIVFVSRVNKSTVMGGRNKDIEIESEGTAKLLKQALNKKGINNISEIHGGTKKKPDKEMDAFQSGKNDIVIATIESGGTGINLDDRDGDKPRSLIILTPPFSAVENVQAAGRVWRLKTKSYPEIDYVFTNTKVDNWNRAIISNKMQSLGAIVSGETGKLSVEDKKIVAKLSDRVDSPRPPKPKKKKRN